MTEQVTYEKKFKLFIDREKLNELCAAGLPLKEIAKELGVSYPTAEYRIRHWKIGYIAPDRRQ